MKRGAARRRAVVAAFATAGAIAACSYAAVLSSARSDWSRELRPGQAVEVLGSLATPSRNAMLEPNAGSIAFALNGSARWHFSTASLNRNARRSVLIVSGELLYADRHGRAWVNLDGVRASLLRDVDYGPLTLPPAATRGFRVEIPPGNPCMLDTCDLEVHVDRAYWRIYRVAVVTDDVISSVGEFR